MTRWWWALPGALALAASGLAASRPTAPWTAEQDHADMLRQLGIARLRPGLSGDETAPAHVNYDEAKANPHPVWPDPLRFDDGRPVRSAAEWPRRRAEIAAAFERQVVGRVPATAPAIAWQPGERETEWIAGRRVTAQRVIGRADNRAHPALSVAIELMLVLPADAKGPVPTLVMFAPARFPAPSQPGADEARRLNAALREMVAARDPALGAIFAAHPGFEFVRPAAFPPSPPADGRIATLVAAGWGVALLDPATIQADSGAGLRAGVIGLANRGQPRQPDDWGALRAWGWGASRAFDHLLARPEIDGKRIGIEGVSRWGKAALVTAAFDERFAAVLIGSAGEGGMSPYRRDYGEAPEHLASSGEYHWLAGNFLRYAADAPVRGTAADLPVDAHQLLALVAPRLAFVSYGVPEAGDARWLDHQGSFMATVAAGKVWRLLGARDLGRGDDYARAVMPPVNTGLIDGALAWRQHDGGHTDAPNIEAFTTWAERRWAPPAGTGSRSPSRAP